MLQRTVQFPKKHSFFLFGPRQTGKSTLIRQSFSPSSTHYYDLLQLKEYERLQANPSLFREEIQSRDRKIQQVVLDEIQRVPQLLDEVHSLIEEKLGLQFILTGSSARKLKASHANLLAGRALTYHLHPLTYEELGERFSLQSALQYGTLPSVYLEEESMRNHILRSYAETYLKEEIEQEAQLRQIGPFIRFLNLAAIENGNVLNYSNLGRETGTSPNTIKSYFKLLEDTLLGFFLHPYLKSSRKRLAKHPKFYFFDTGVLRALQKRISVPLIPKTPDYGQAFEHWMILEVLRFSDYRFKDWTLSYYRTESGSEVDLIIETPQQKIIAIEFKSTDQISSIHLKGLKSFSQDCPSAELYCICSTPRRYRRGNTNILPWQEMHSFLENI